jgi:hypothetical protein
MWLLWLIFGVPFAGVIVGILFHDLTTKEKD